jgi:divalent metal cation (Fe/Co/Zn/Cd) transporter
MGFKNEWLNVITRIVDNVLLFAFGLFAIAVSLLHFGATYMFGAKCDEGMRNCRPFEPDHIAIHIAVLIIAPVAAIAWFLFSRKVADGQRDVRWLPAFWSAAALFAWAIVQA